MNDKYIKLDDAIHVINCTNTFTFSRERTIEKLREVLVADVRPVVRVRWKKSYDCEEHGKNYHDVLRCSACRVISDHETNFFPYCGAYMRNFSLLPKLQGSGAKHSEQLRTLIYAE